MKSRKGKCKFLVCTVFMLAFGLCACQQSTSSGQPASTAQTAAEETAQSTGMAGETQVQVDPAFATCLSMDDADNSYLLMTFSNYPDKYFSQGKQVDLKVESLESGESKEYTLKTPLQFRWNIEKAVSPKTVTIDQDDMTGTATITPVEVDISLEKSPFKSMDDAKVQLVCKDGSTVDQFAPSTGSTSGEGDMEKTVSFKEFHDMDDFSKLKIGDVEIPIE